MLAAARVIPRRADCEGGPVNEPASRKANVVVSKTFSRRTPRPIHAAEGTLPAAFAGGLIAQATGPMTDFALDLLDEFLIEGLSRGWQPRMLFDALRKLKVTNTSSYLSAAQ